MKKNGFTLIELLAVIVILAIIALIATPIVLDIISDTKRNSTLRSGEFYLDAVEQAIAKEMMIDPTFKAKECMIKEDGNLLCSELGFNECGFGELKGLELIVSCGSDSKYLKEVNVNVKGETPTEGLIKLNDGSLESAQLNINNESLVMNEKELVFESDREVIYEADHVLLTSEDSPLPYLNIGTLDPNSIYYLDVDLPALNIAFKTKALIGDYYGMNSFFHEIDAGILPYFEESREGLIKYDAKFKIEKLNELENYGLRITKNNNIYFYSNEFEVGTIYFFVQEEELVPIPGFIAKCDNTNKFGNYVECYSSLGGNEIYEAISAGHQVYIIIYQEINGKQIIRKYGERKPKYQATHQNTLVNDSYYWGSDCYPVYKDY